MLLAFSIYKITILIDDYTPCTIFQIAVNVHGGYIHWLTKFSVLACSLYFLLTISIFST
jgi:hypothetical protein